MPLSGFGRWCYDGVGYGDYKVSGTFNILILNCSTALLLLLSNVLLSGCHEDSLLHFSLKAFHVNHLVLLFINLPLLNFQLQKEFSRKDSFFVLMVLLF